MQRFVLRQGLFGPLRLSRPSTLARPFWKSPTCYIQTDAHSKYKEKLLQRAKEAGLSLDELKQQAKKTAEAQKEAERKALEATLPAHKLQQQVEASSSSTSSASSNPALKAKERKDSSPVKPLSTIFNVEKLVSTPHTPEQISTLWTAYHASRSGGTGRGFVCASIPSDMYGKLEKVGQKYPAFVLPVPRPRPDDTGPLKEGENDTAYEFYFMEWAFHERPPVPQADSNIPFEVPSSKNSTNPPLATVLFTPLQEYKSRQTFATPYLIVTFYTDLVTTHQRVLMRGEITPAAASPTGANGDRYLLSQEDAQVLIMGLQKFYLWTSEGEGESEAAKLLRVFHEKPEDFKWEDLVKIGNLTG
ncbi:F1 ATPase assembly protein 11 [Coprinopsis cinerea AmutBmut pab1-1]|nr:F1 ATPase assembly protein 11 [Coprinopsis cinerea AmutBmut pab1-1]